MFCSLQWEVYFWVNVCSDSWIWGMWKWTPTQMRFFLKIFNGTSYSVAVFRQWTYCLFLPAVLMKWHNIEIFSMAQQPLMGQSLLIIEVLWSHSDILLLVGLLDKWSAWHKDLYLTIHNAHKKQASMAWRDSVLQSQQARCHTDPSLRLCSHWNWWCNIEI